MAVVLQIGAGGVGGVVAHKMAQNREVFSRIILASRTLDKCKAIADSIRTKGLGEIEIDAVDADNVESLVVLIEKYRPKLVVNVALPYQDLSIMEACLRTKTHYLDTANYEHPDSAHFEYKEQWAYDTRYKEAGIFALLGSGFDPGVTNVFCAYAQKHYFDEIYSIDILDCNAGDHGYAFATNFNPEINLREVSSKARYWVKDSALKAKAQELSGSKNFVSEADRNLNSDLQQDSIYRKFEREEKHWEAEVWGKEQKRLQKLANLTQPERSILEEKSGLCGSEQGNKTGASIDEANDKLHDFNPKDKLKNEDYAGGQWRDIPPLALMKEWDYPEVGVKNSYLLYHEELESLVRNIKGLQRIRFFMTFGESYLTHMKCLENVGLLRVDSVEHKGQKIVPIEVLKTLLPDPASLASRTKGKTNIGCYMKGVKNGKERTIYIYNVCEHEKCYEEVNAQGVSYTTGVPAMIGAKLICEGKWGVGAKKNVALTQSLWELENSLCDSQNRLVSAEFSTQPTNLKQNLHSLESDEQVHSANTSIFDSSSLETFNKNRLTMNADMPKGGEYQGIDNALELQNKIQDRHNAEVTMSERNSKIGDEKLELRSCECGDKTQVSIAQMSDKPSDLSLQAEFQGAGVWNMEQNDPDPFMRELNKQGLPYVVLEIESNGKAKVLEDGRKQ